MGWCEPEYERLDPKEQKTHFRYVIIGLLVSSLIIIVVVSAGVGVVVQQITANSCNPSPLADGVVGLNITDVNAHLLALQAVASANNGNRALGTSGYAASLQYVRSQLAAYPDYFNLTEQVFLVQNWTTIGTPSLSVRSNVSYKLGTQWAPVVNSVGTSSGGLQYPLWSVDNQGCTLADFNGPFQTRIAIIARGGCSLDVKVNNSVAVGARGVIIINYPCFDFEAYLSNESTIPVILVASDIGYSWWRVTTNPPVIVNINFQTDIQSLQTWNLIADTKQGGEEGTIVVGSHLDSVYAGPGLNDNASGSSINLAIALQMARKKVSLENRIRFAWWGAEEEGLFGSINYLDSLTPDELDQIVANVNLDMIASPNFERGVNNASTVWEQAAFMGSLYIQDLYTTAMSAMGLNYTLVPLDDGSDYWEFINFGIPAGGIFTGAEEFKSVEERVVFGGVANAEFDPCYHQSCDTYANVNQLVLQQNGNASATAVYALGRLSDIRTTLGIDTSARPDNTKTFEKRRTSAEFRSRFSRFKRFNRI